MDPSKVDPQEYHDPQMAKVLEESPDFVIIRDGRVADMGRNEKLLFIEDGKLDGVVLRFPEHLCNAVGGLLSRQRVKSITLLAWVTLLAGLIHRRAMRHDVCALGRGIEC